jgi:hypothetical protein
MTLVSFLVGFRLHGGIADGLIAFALIIVFSFAFEWVFITFGLFASNAQAAQGLAFLMVPLTFVSSAYVTVSSMPGWLQAFAANQPVTYMIDAVRSLTGGGPRRSAARSSSQLLRRALPDVDGGDRAGVRDDRRRSVPAWMTKKEIQTCVFLASLRVS